MNIININQFQILAFTLVLLRCTGFFMSWSLFSGANVPAPLKVLLSLLVAMICFSLIKSHAYPTVDNYQTMIILAVKEALVGLAMGFLTNLIFYGVNAAGEMISVSMGLSASQIFNPAMGTQQASVSQIYFFLAAFLFLAIRGHHFFLIGLSESFNLVPLHVFLPKMDALGEFSLLGQKILEVGLMLSAPVMVAILLVNFALGIMGRAVPQINVLITSLPINALVGFSVLILVLPLFVESLKAEIFNFTEVLFGFLKVF